MPDAMATIHRLIDTFDAEADHQLIEHPLHLPEGWQLLIVGEKRGRCREFHITPQGDVQAAVKR